MIEKISFSNFALGEDISEVRNQIDSIRQFLVDPNVQSEIADLFIDKMQELRAIKKTHENLSEVEDYSKDEHIVSEEDKYFNLIKTDIEKVKVHFMQTFSPVIVRFINQLTDVFKMRPMRINVMQVCVIEFCFWMSQKREPIKSTTLENGEIRIVSQQTSIEDFAQKRIFLIRDDYDRKVSLMNRNIVALLGNEKGLEMYAQKLFSENISSTDPMFGLYFAFTLSQCSIIHIKEFLNYQKEEFEGDFIFFLEAILIKYRHLIAESHIVMAQHWMKNQENKQIQISDSMSSKQQSEFVEDVARESKDDMGEEPLKKYVPINGNLSEKEIEKFFSFLYLETNGEKKPFLSKDDVVKLLENGFVLAEKPNRKFKLNLEGDKSKGIVYYAIHCLFTAHSRSNKDKKFIAQFFYDNFKDFSKVSFENFMNAISPTKPKTMVFDLKKNNYLRD